MIKVYIDGSDRPLDQVTESWLRDAIGARRSAGQNVCVRVLIQAGNIDLTLSTPACARGGGGGRPLRPEEQAVVDLWDKRGMNANDFKVGQLNAFLKEMKHV